MHSNLINLTEMLRYVESNEFIMYENEISNIKKTF